MPYYAHIKERGSVIWHSRRHIGVLEATGDPMFIGEATCEGWDKNGLVLWTLVINGKPIEGRWVIIDREFRLVIIDRELRPV